MQNKKRNEFGGNLGKIEEKNVSQSKGVMLSDNRNMK